VSTPLHPTYLYIDEDFRSKCHTYWAGYGPDLCEEKEIKTDDEWTIHRCVYCHDKELKSISCLGTTGGGRRCKRTNTLPSGYCSTHSIGPQDRFLDQLDRHYSEPLSFEQWKDNYTKAAYAQVKRTILRDAATHAHLLKIQLNELINYTESIKTYVYFIQCKNYVKIGRSDIPKSRLKSLQSKNDKTLRPKDITVEDMQEAKIAFILRGAGALERYFHHHLWERRVEGEWFVIDSYVAKLMQRLQDPEFDLQNILHLAEEDPSIFPDIDSKPWSSTGGPDKELLVAKERVEYEYNIAKKSCLEEEDALLSGQLLKGARKSEF
jgi:hypothetical protein